MAFVADYDEEELNRALQAVGPTPGASSGPGQATGAASPAGAALSAPGPAQGTGFVNLSRYFDANADGASRSANALVDPLKVDLQSVGQAAYDSVPKPTAPVFKEPYGEPQTPRSDPDPEYDARTRAALERADRERTEQQTAYDQSLTTALSQAEQARARSMLGAQTSALEQGRGLLSDVNKQREAVAGDSGVAPSSFDSYLTGAALPSAFKGLEDYYSPQNSGLTRPAPPPPPLPRERPPGTPVLPTPPDGSRPAPPPGGGFAPPLAPPESPLTPPVVTPPLLRERPPAVTPWTPTPTGPSRPPPPPLAPGPFTPPAGPTAAEILNPRNQRDTRRRGGR